MLILSCETAIKLTLFFILLPFWSGIRQDLYRKELWRNWYYVKLERIHVSHLDFILDIWTFFCYCPTRQEKRPWERDCVWLWWTKTLTNMCFESRFKGTFKVMELGMEVGRALWVGSHGALWKVVTRGQPTGWHPWSASHCLCFRSSKVASFLSLFGVCLLKRGLGYFPWNNKSFWNLNSPLNETLKPCL